MSDAAADATGTAGSAGGSGSLEVQGEPLDRVLANETPTYLKMDIDGAEPDALLGARRTLERCRPTLAVCVYHEQDHLWRIPLWIDSLKLGYRFFLRPHHEECWDLILYAIPEGR